MLPGPDELLHFSEDPTITTFHPHVAPTARQAQAYVWAVDAVHSPSYWFPRKCPRAMAWIDARTTPEDAARVLGPGANRVHAIEYGWLSAMQEAKLFAYRMPKAAFSVIDPDDPVAWVASETVTPLGPAEAVGDLLELHRAAGIQLRLVDRLWPWWDEVITSTVGFSGIRLRNGMDYPYS